MTSVRVHKLDPVELQREIKRLHDLAESSRSASFVAARKIQAWFRGIVTRKHHRKLYETATTIQRHWRGYKARIAVEDYLIKHVHEKWQLHYDAMATQIQAIWRGYWVRRNGVDIRKMRSWLCDVYEKNDQILERMKRFRECEFENIREIMEHESMLWILHILFKLHHLLGTKIRPGVLTRIDKTSCMVIEKAMRCLEYTLYSMKRNRERCNQKSSMSRTLLLKGTYFERCEREIRELEESIRQGRVSLNRSLPYDESRRVIKTLECPGEDPLEKRLQRKPFDNFSRIRSQGASLLHQEPYRPKPSIGREPRNRKKELDGDFKLFFKPREIFEAVYKMDCRFDRIRLRCPIHGNVFPFHA